ncbi:MAG: hypothetical protein KatS3mg121_0946 [Gammaproteobacteria bacterium]|nr:MAG: hypothetical protein KatS3mg121_0946 [Gammaproteobacteria bacterium]
MSREKQGHWLTRPATIRRLWYAFGAVLAAVVAAQFFVHVHAVAGVDGLFGFHAAYGFLSCVAMVLAAKLLGVWLKRPDDYYADDRHDV